MKTSFFIPTLVYPSHLAIHTTAAFSIAAPVHSDPIYPKTPMISTSLHTDLSSARLLSSCVTKLGFKNSPENAVRPVFDHSEHREFQSKLRAYMIDWFTQTIQSHFHFHSNSNHIVYLPCRDGVNRGSKFLSKSHFFSWILHGANWCCCIQLVSLGIHTWWTRQSYQMGGCFHGKVFKAT